MAKWVLHTETKGTGAHMVPLESASRRSGVSEPIFVPRKPQPREEEVPKPRPARRFRVVDVMTREALAEGSAREAVDVLKDVRSIVDVNVFVWQEEQERWRMLTFAEQRVVWELARQPLSVAPRR